MRGVAHSAFLGTVGFAAGQLKTRNLQGSILCTFMFSPRDPMFVGTPMGKFAEIFQRWKPIRAVMRFTPVVTYFVPGQLVMGWNKNPISDLWGSATSIVQSMKAREGSLFSQAFTPQNLTMPTSYGQSLLYNDAKGVEPRLNTAARFDVVVVSPILKPDGGLWEGELGTLWLDFEVDFQHLDVKPGTGPTIEFEAVVQYNDEENTFEVIEGSNPGTALGYFTFRDPGALVSVSPGSQWAYNFDVATTNRDQNKFQLFGTYTGAVMKDYEDALVPEIVGVSTLVTGTWTPLGPQLGARTGNDSTVIIRGTSQAEDQVSVVPAVFETTDRRVPIDGSALVELVGTNSFGSTQRDPIETIVENEIGFEVGVPSDMQLTLYNANTQQVFTQLQKVPGGFTQAEFLSVFGKSPSTKTFIGMLFSSALKVVRIASTVAEIVTVTLKVVRTIRGLNAETMISQLIDANIAAFTAARDKVTLRVMQDNIRDEELLKADEFTTRLSLSGASIRDLAGPSLTRRRGAILPEPIPPE